MSTNLKEQFNLIANAKPDVEVRVTSNMEVGDAIHQGDVYIFRVDNKHPRGNLWGSNQVAVGNTVGSRHIAVGPVTVKQGKKLPSWVKERPWINNEQVLGPVVEATGDWTLTHPEHAHHTMPAGTYQVLYQADGRTMRAVQD